MTFREYVRRERRRRRMMAVTAMVLAGIILVAFGCGSAAPKGHLVTETYIVATGDTLDDISYEFMAKSSMPRDVREFRQGIVEENWSIFEGRQPGMIFPGDKLTVNYWAIADEQ